MAKKKTVEEKKETSSLHFEHEGKTYQFLAKRFTLNGKDIEAEDAARDQEVIAELIEIGAGVIKLIS